MRSSAHGHFFSHFLFVDSSNAGDCSIHAQTGNADEATPPDSDDDLLEDVAQGSASGSHLPLLLSETPGIGTTSFELRRGEVADATDIRYVSFFIISAISMTLSLFDNAWVITASQVRMDVDTCGDVRRRSAPTRYCRNVPRYFFTIFPLYSHPLPFPPIMPIMKGNGTVRRNSLSRLSSACGHGRDPFLVLRDAWDIVCAFVADAVSVRTVRVTGPVTIVCSEPSFNVNVALCLPLRGSLSLLPRTQALPRLRF